MEKEKLLKIFEELLDDYEQAEDVIEHDRGVGDSGNYVNERIREYRKKFTDELYGEKNEN